MGLLGRNSVEESLQKVHNHFQNWSKNSLKRDLRLMPWRERVMDIMH